MIAAQTMSAPPLDRLAGVARIAAALSLGLMAGFFFAFSNPTMMGFARADGATFVTAMQLINLEVRNLTFFIAFAAPLPLAALALLTSRPRWPWVTAFLLYAAAVGVTRAVNIPINDAMALWDVANLPADWADIRDRWTLANHVRTALSAAGCLAALVGVSRAAKQPGAA
mgnify:CR=1 FL=1